jgi:hypothetical protein
MYSPTIDESEFQGAVKSALDSYVRNCSGANLGEAYTPGPVRQAFRNINRTYCFDIIKRLTESELLILELKVATPGGGLRSFNVKQWRVYCALWKTNLPIYYCFNLADDYVQKSDPVYTLENSGVAPPPAYSKGVFVGGLEGTVSLKEKVDQMMIDHSRIKMPTKTTAVAALFSKGVIRSVRDLNTKMLLFAYNASERVFTLYTTEELTSFYDIYESSVSLGRGIDLSTASAKEIIAHFASAVAMIRWILTPEIEDTPDDGERRLYYAYHRRGGPGEMHHRLYQRQRSRGAP